ncbi:ADP-ribosylation factor-binding protein GGA1 isoform X1 [Ictalurus punctatus]|uniref:ADP-ribosylation factor-binding protein GGA1 isoform X1 n=1 Tax=Ictalurus punctatus TaxID=7998 RepID=A0A2D0Q6Z5_ICTPU|nr:ADP-ribosylation factor-binding protein GGA1 isoform X1 [Ictalurus punctatus]
MAEEEQSVDFLLVCLNKATDPENPSERWDCMQEFYQHVNTLPNGPQIATRLLAHKIQSPQEKEALQALTLLEVCMNNCGKRFHSEAAKFRFLNELIKVLSPKYLGVWSTEQVKQKVMEVLYSWTRWLKDEPKVQEAYSMLKKQGIVKKDPKLPDTIALPPPSPRQEVSVFDNEDKSKMLSRLLKSGRPEDLQMANTLIKSTLQEEQEKMEKESRRVSTLQEVETCTSQLKLLLNQQHTQHTPEMQDLYERCDRLRSSLFRLASDTVDNDEALAEILRRNDELTHVMNLYREKTQKPQTETDTTLVSPVKSYHLIDFSLLGDSAPCGQVEQSTTLLQDEEQQKIHGADSGRNTLGVKSYLDELLQLEDTVKVTRETGQMEMAYRNEDYNTHNASVLAAIEPELRSRSASRDNQPVGPGGLPEPRPVSSLSDITVSLDSITPSHIKPITVFNHRGVHVSLHFTKEALPSHPDVAVIIVSVVNTSPLPVSDFLFLAAVPKSMCVRLQAATGSTLPPYSPLLPPAALSQILLLSNPLRKPVRLRFRVTLSLGQERLQQDGDIDQFPQWNSWIHL